MQGFLGYQKEEIQNIFNEIMHKRLHHSMGIRSSFEGMKSGHDNIVL